MNKNKNIIKHSLQALKVSVVLMIICGLIFPLFLTAVSHFIFPSGSKGNLIEINGEYVGAEFVGQEFSEPYFMKGRPSAVHYNTYIEDEEGNKTYRDGSEFGGLASGSNNYGPSNENLKERVQNDLEVFLENNPNVEKKDIPTDLMTASGSGLDPHISKESAMIQVEGLSKASGLTVEQLESIIDDNTEGKLFGIFGQETVNVLGVNIDIASSMGLIK